MQSLRKAVGNFSGEKYRNLPYGTIYIVAGSSPTSKEVNEYAKNHMAELARRINSKESNWITCEIVYADSDNPLFPSRPQATLYSAILPTSETPDDSYSFFATSLDFLVPESVESAILEHFSTLQQMLDEILDIGKYEEYHLRKSILSPTDDSGIRFSISRTSGDTRLAPDDVLFSITSQQPPFPYTELSRLEITPNNYQILLPDYNLEFHFGAQVKALYVLFLNHPEGIRMNEIYDYKEEFTRLYMNFTNRSDVERLREGVENLFDVFSPNAMNVKKSQCNSTICRVIPKEDLNRYYVIEAPRGLPHKINLYRFLVSIPEKLRS